MNEQDITPYQIDLLSEHLNQKGLTFLQLLYVLWKGKLAIILFTVVFAVTSVATSLLLPNTYRAETTLSLAQQDKSAMGLSGQLGGLASLAGINVGDGNADRSQLALEVLRSRAFVSEFIETREILPDLMAVSEWIAEGNRLLYDPAIYKPDSKTWVREVDFPRSVVPSMQEAYDKFIEILNVSENKQTGIVKVSIDHLSPHVAKDWTNWLIEDLNNEMRQRDLTDSRKTVEYLEEKLNNVVLAEMQSILFQLIEEQIKTIMLAEVMDEYVFKTVDPAIAPELKHSPQRAIICILGTLVGGILGVLFVLIRHFAKLQD
ncbi:Wzz/FepE/Etk N-terminal domain-containing protein [Aliagarivorans taiwanensis]|uniref:Wzz/FepE/Etk N-terminal domain-containing protein n=1 Tax=Aliagarivorans taiwanensis TaxID=561966 RepID=UPI00047A7F3A|nr:Wzz/FepE/Etk N-terminal domain-containing protein [Aliagarivorans taiwanensis]